MASMVASLGAAFDRGERGRLGGFYACVLLLNLLGWGGLLTYGGGHPAFVGLGFLAFTFGLRHAFDADHIAAIDNTTRKLLQERRKPVGVGFFFSLGHSTVVFVIALLLALAVRTVVQSVVSDHGQLHDIGGLIGTSVSGVFLIAIGVLNLVVLVDILGIYRRMQRGQYDRRGLEAELQAGGPFVKLFGRLFRFVRASWHLYPIGILFGLGFDTATEVALLAVSAGAAARGLPFLAILSLPLLFAGGMCLMDTTDGAFMSKAYAWAFSNPIRKVFYNLTITSLSVFVALFVGLVEVLQIVSRTFAAAGGVLGFVDNLDFETVGFVIVAAFVVTWAGALVVYRVRRVEERWGRAVVEEAAATGE